ncbi:MAG: hypothetical protein KDD34_02310 [Bdellovibrionales bacterium]|nr:hypothetical protein [Bdellovibrionales bacterium]
MILTMVTVFATETNAATEKEIQPEKYILCKNKSVVRTIRVETSSEGCQAKYTKAGIDKIIGYGTQQETCNRFVENVKNNLEGAAWSCRAISDSKITAEANSEE